MALKPVTDAEAATRRLSKSVEIDPERLGGEPVFRGTRVPVKSLFDHLSAGDSMETFLDDFPGVTREQVQAVVEVAGLHLLEEVLTRIFHKPSRNSAKNRSDEPDLPSLCWWRRWGFVADSVLSG